MNRKRSREDKDTEELVSERECLTSESRGETFIAVDDSDEEEVCLSDLYYSV